MLYWFQELHFERKETVRKMRYDFTTMPDRHGKDSIAVDSIGMGGFAPAAPGEGYNAIPMWVADMNFQVCPTIQEEIIKRVQHPAFGYFDISGEYYDSIIRWQAARNGVADLEPKHIGYENGVLGGVTSALNVLCSRGDYVLMHSPTYIGFTKVLNENGYHAALSSLKRDQDGVWRMDYEDMERLIREKHVRAAILCNPHNPTGRAWEKSELEEAMKLFEKYSIPVISDEIWSDILLNGHKHIPTQSVNDYARENTAAFYAPSKTFNLAGLVGSYHIIYNDRLRERIRKESSMTFYNAANVLSMHALIGAYKPEGSVWVDELKEVLSENINYAYDMILREFDGITLAKPEGTYMLFLHCEDWCRKHGKTMEDLQKLGTDVGVAWQDGRPFHDPWGIRMNLALPHAVVQEAFRRLEKYVFCV